MLDLDEPSGLSKEDPGVVEAHAPMLKGKTALSFVEVILTDPVHVAYIEAGYCITGVCANG